MGLKKDVSWWKDGKELVGIDDTMMTQKISLAQAEGEVTRLKASLANAKVDVSKLKEEAIKLQGLLAKI